jgi:hypothetical protein
MLRKFQLPSDRSANPPRALAHRQSGSLQDSPLKSALERLAARQKTYLK